MGFSFKQFLSQFREKEIGITWLTPALAGGSVKNKSRKNDFLGFSNAKSTSIFFTFILNSIFTLFTDIKNFEKKPLS